MVKSLDYTRSVIPHAWHYFKINIMFNTQTSHRFEKFINASFLLLFAFGLAVATWLTVSHTAPARQINVLQALFLDGQHMPLLTIMVLIFPIVLALIILKTVCVFLFNHFWLKEGEEKIPYAYKIRWR